MLSGGAVIDHGWARQSRGKETRTWIGGDGDAVDRCRLGGGAAEHGDVGSCEGWVVMVMGVAAPLEAVVIGSSRGYEEQREEMRRTALAA